MNYTARKHSLRLLSALLVLLTILPVIPLSLPSGAEEVESRKTPIMGWASWNAYRTDISEEIILSQAEKLVELGLKDLGYVFVNVDDGWQNGRGEDGYVNINQKRFPSGMKDLAEKIHAMGLKAGIYTDAGASTCGWASDNEVNNDDVGLLGHEEQDLRRYFIDWEYDFIKVDWCGGRDKGLDKQERYTMIGKEIAAIEKEIGKDKIYNICCWSFPGEWAVDIADSWRTGGDIFNNFGAVLEQLDNIKSLAKYNTPGHVNDLDMMQVGNGMSYEEDKSHFAMWCMMSTPLMLGMDLNSISEETLSIVSNAELIALNQDPACIQATVAKNYGQVEAWTKDLGAKNSGKKAIALLNRESSEQTVTISFKELGLDGVTVVRDLWAHADLATDDRFTVTIPAHGTVVLTAEGTPVATEGDKDILIDDGSVVKAEMTIKNKPSSMNLTTMGKYDWAHFGNETTRMREGAGEITVRYDGSYVTYGNAAATYNWTNAKSNPKSGSSTWGAGVKGTGATILLSTPCDQNERTLIATAGSFSAEMTIELIVGGKIIDSKVIPGGSDKKVDKLVTMTYKSDVPTTAYLRWYVSKSLGYSDSVNVEGVALNIDISENTLTSPDLFANRETGKTEASVKVTSPKQDALLHFAVKDNKGTLQSIHTEKIEKSNKTVSKTVALDLPGDFIGTLYTYLWDGQNLPLATYTTAALDTTSASGYNVGPMTAKRMIAEGGILLDVRTPGEFERGHLEGAVNMDYSKVALEAEKTFTDKNKTIVVYCSAAKRSAQAVDALLKLGYTKVYNLGSMDNFHTSPLITFSTDTCRVITAGEKVGVNFTASPYDKPQVLVSAGKSSTLKDAVALSEFKVPEVDDYYLTLKAYLVQDGVCHATVEKQFIYWSEETVDTFATDLEWTEASIGWGTIHKDKSVGGNTLKLAGKNFSHGIGTHANSTIKMGIPQGAKKFLAVAGCDLEMSGSNTMMFFVYIDGVEADHSSLIKIGQHYVFDVDIPEGAKEITLYAYEGTYGGNTNDHADWTVAGFINNPTEG